MLCDNLFRTYRQNQTERQTDYKRRFYANHHRLRPTRSVLKPAHHSLTKGRHVNQLAVGCVQQPTHLYVLSTHRSTRCLYHLSDDIGHAVGVCVLFVFFLFGLRKQRRAKKAPAIRQGLIDINYSVGFRCWKYQISRPTFWSSKMYQVF